jgi:hypothetical protein
MKIFKSTGEGAYFIYNYNVFKMADIQKLNVNGTTYDISTTWSKVTGKPSTFPAESHTHPYLPLSGGTIEGNFGALKVKINNQYGTGITFINTEKTLGTIGFEGNGNPTWWNGTGTNAYTLIHSGNIGNQSVNSLYHKHASLGNYYFKPCTYGYFLEGQYPTLRIRNTNEYNSQIEFSDKDDILRWSLSYRGVNSADNDFHFYKVNNDVVTPVLALDYSSGNVLIGTTSDKGYKLDVNGTTCIRSGNYTTLIEAAAGKVSGSGIAFWNGSGWQKATINASTLYLNNDNVGNVLIGTEMDAGYKLAVNGEYITFDFNRPNTKMNLILVTRNTMNSYMYNISNKHMIKTGVTGDVSLFLEINGQYYS